MIAKSPQTNPFVLFSCAPVALCVILATTLLFLAGCAGKDARNSYFPVMQQEARVRWEQSNRDRLISDVVFSHDATDGAALVIGKHQTYLELLRRGDNLRASGRMARPAWRGAAASAPHPISDWGTLLEAWQTARNLPGDGKKEIHTRNFRVSFERAGGILVNMMVLPSGTGSTFMVRFTN